MTISIPEGYIKHPENKDKIFSALAEYFNSDVLICSCGEEFYNAKKKSLLSILEDEPRLLEILKDDLS